MGMQNAKAESRVDLNNCCDVLLSDKAAKCPDIENIVNHEGAATAAVHDGVRKSIFVKLALSRNSFSSSRLPRTIARESVINTNAKKRIFSPSFRGVVFTSTRFTALCNRNHLLASCFPQTKVAKQPNFYSINDYDDEREWRKKLSHSPQNTFEIENSWCRGSHSIEG